MIPEPEKSINEGGLIYYKNMVGSDNLEWQTFVTLSEHYNIDLDKPLNKFTKKEMDIILNGSKEPIRREIVSKNGNVRISNKGLQFKQVV